MSILDLMRANLMEARTLAAIRDALLPKLISGQVSLQSSENVCIAGGQGD
ncbi:MAG: hypothetical protein IPM18_09365 [Phycisphaerales bacterium]|nr:hypothetical protein [Phycisphaerales bacterium]